VSQQILSLAGTVVGAILGLLAPMVSSRAGRRECYRGLQRQIASDIGSPSENGDSPVQALHSRESRLNQRVCILALRLGSRFARNSCMSLIVFPGKSPDDGELFKAWEIQDEAVGAAYRRRRRARF
jgi:hypothetical protein